MLNDLKLSLQYILPKLWLTRLAGWGASKRAGWLTKLVIDLFVKYYKVDMKEAQKPDTAAYRTFNDFFRAPAARRRSPAEYRSKRAGDAGRWRDQPAWRH